MKGYQGQQYIYIFIIIVLLGFTGWYYAKPTPPTNLLSQEALSHIPDVIVNELEVSQFNEKGVLTNHFYTPQLIHFPSQNLSQFTAPRITLYPATGEPWFIQADRGESEKGSEKITLWEHVILHQNPSGTEKERTITTSEITYFAEQDLAETPKMIFFEQPGIRVQSLGMIAHLKEQKIHLLQQVWSEYLPNENA